VTSYLIPLKMTTPKWGTGIIQLLNNKQILVIASTLLIFIMLAVFPPWRYMDGSSAGFAPVFNPPADLPDSLVTGEIATEYVPIKIVPSTLSTPGDRKTDLTTEDLATPFVDIRRMLTVGTVVFLIGVIGLFAFDDRTRSASEELTVQALNKAKPPKNPNAEQT
jgi:hypothetical protein